MKIKKIALLIVSAMLLPFGTFAAENETASSKTENTELGDKTLEEVKNNG